MSVRERERQRDMRAARIKYSPPARGDRDAAIVAGVTVEASLDTHAARLMTVATDKRPQRIRRNTMSKGYLRDRFDAEESAGRARITPPTAAGVRERDDWGMAFPRQHMATASNPDEKLRTRVTMRKNLFLNSAEGGPDDTNHMWPGTYAFDGTAETGSGVPPRVREEPVSMK